MWHDDLKHHRYGLIPSTPSTVFESFDTAATQRLKSDLWKGILSSLAGQKLRVVGLRPRLESDIRLNAINIAIWWRSRHSG